MIEDLLTVCGPQDLDLVLAADRRRIRHIKLLLPSMPAQELQDWETRLNGDFRACGCEVAAIAMVIALAIVVMLGFTFSEDVLAHPFIAGTVAMMSLFLASGFGKMIGLRRARLRLKDAVASLRDQTSTAS